MNCFLGIKIIAFSENPSFVFAVGHKILKDLPQLGKTWRKRLMNGCWPHAKSSVLELKVMFSHFLIIFFFPIDSDVIALL